LFFPDFEPQRGLWYAIGVSALLLASMLAATPINDGWAWTRLKTSSGPSARRNHAMVHDPVHRVTVVFGGLDIRPGKSTCLGDTWTFDGTKWKQVKGPGPAAREGALVVFDEGRERTVLFGGACGDRWFNDAWEFDGRAWTLVETTTVPEAGHGVAFVYERSTRAVVLLNADVSSQMNPRCELWRLVGHAWKLARDTCERKDPIPGGTVAWFDDSSGVTMLGQAPDRRLHLVGRRWTLEGDTWSHSDADVEQGTLLGSGGAWSASERVLLSAGGADARWRMYDGALRLLELAPSPAPRMKQGMTWDSTNRRFLVFGGHLVGEAKVPGMVIGAITNELWALTPSAARKH
jgi:hypothetical protein